MSSNQERFFQVMLIMLTILIVLAVSQSRAAELVDVPVSATMLKPTNDKTGRTVLTLDLTKHLGKQSLSAVRLEAKAGIGGGQVLLKVKAGRGESYSDSRRVETDPDDFGGAGGWQKIELKNRDRDIKTLTLVGLNPLRIQKLQLVLGAPQEVRLVGTYGGVDSKAVKSRPLVKEGPAVAHQQVALKVPVEKPRAKCIRNFCIGTRVRHLRTFWEGQIVTIEGRSGRVSVRFEGDDESFVAPVHVGDLKEL